MPTTYLHHPPDSVCIHPHHNLAPIPPRSTALTGSPGATLPPLLTTRAASSLGVKSPNYFPHLSKSAGSGGGSGVSQARVGAGHVGRDRAPRHSLSDPLDVSPTRRHSLSDAVDVSDCILGLAGWVGLG